MERCDDQVDQFDADKRNDEAAEAIDEKIALQDGQCAHRFVGHARAAPAGSAR